MTILFKKSKYHVLMYSRIRDDFSCEIPVLEFLREHANIGDQKASVSGLKKLFERYAENGSSALTTDLFHEADKTEKIFEFIKGRIRVLCFKDENKIILTNGLVKKTQKASTQDVAIAIAAKKEYFQN